MDRAILVIIDDDRSFIQAVSRYLGRRGYRTICAHNGSDGLALLRNGGAALAIIDVHLPDLSGLEVMERLQTNGHDLPCILISSDDRPYIQDRCRAVGAVRFLPKPLAPEELLSTIAETLEKEERGDHPVP